MNNHWKLLAATHLAAGFTGFVIAPRDLLESEVQSAGLFATDVKRVLAATVISLRNEHRLQVFSYRGFASVRVERTKFWILTGTQSLQVPASVSYFVDLSKLSENDVVYDAATNMISVTLPPLVLGDVAMQPEAADKIASGLLTYSQGQLDELERVNYLNARRAFIKQAQGATLVAAARAEAERCIAAAFAVPLRALGRPDVRVQAHFAT